MVLSEIFSLQHPDDSNDNGLVINDETSHFNDLNLVLLEDQEEVASEPQLKTITIEEYKKLMELMLKVNKYEETIKKMEDKIKLKDVQIKTLRDTLETKQCIRVGHLSDVSKLR